MGFGCGGGRPWHRRRGKPCVGYRRRRRRGRHHWSRCLPWCGRRGFGHIRDGRCRCRYCLGRRRRRCCGRCRCRCRCGFAGHALVGHAFGARIGRHFLRSRRGGNCLGRGRGRLWTHLPGDANGEHRRCGHAEYGRPAAARARRARCHRRWGRLACWRLHGRTRSGEDRRVQCRRRALFGAAPKQACQFAFFRRQCIVSVHAFSPARSLSIA